MMIRILPRQHQDLRSLATFRFLLGFYILYDITSRLQHGRLSLQFYTSKQSLSSSSSSSTHPPLLHPNDTPHNNPIHVIWFYRGSELFQMLMFTFTAILALMYSLGYSPQEKRGDSIRGYSSCSSFLWVKLLLWLNVTAMQCRNMHVHDGSDTFTRHLLLWSIFLPMNQKWSMNSYFNNQKNKLKTKMNTYDHLNDGQQKQLVEVCTEDSNNNMAVWGLRLQIVFMYLGTVAARTIDRYGLSSWHLYQHCEWLPPSSSAVYYILNASFAVRDCWLGDIIRNNFLLTQIMTFSAMLIEGIVPIICLINGTRTMTTGSKHGYLWPFLLFKLHFGLLLLMNLPNWQFIGMVASVIWIQTSTWDRIQRRLSIVFPRLVVPPLIEQSTDTRRKKDMEMESYNVENRPKRSLSRMKSFFTNFLFMYMIYNFAGERKWTRKHDGGDIGEFLRFSQYWVMFATPPKTSAHVIFTGKISLNNDDNTKSKEFREVDVWKWMSDGSLQSINLEARRNNIWHNMTSIYPSPRLERMFDQLSSRNNDHVIRYLLKNLCISGPFEELKFIVQYLKVMPPSALQRFKKSTDDFVMEENCILEKE